MSMGAICFTSSGRNGGCWVVLVFPPLFFLWKKDYIPQKKFWLPKKTQFKPKKKLQDLRPTKTRFVLISAIKLRFPPFVNPRCCHSDQLRSIVQVIVPLFARAGFSLAHGLFCMN